MQKSTKYGIQLVAVALDTVAVQLTRQRQHVPRDKVVLHQTVTQHQHHIRTHTQDLVVVAVTQALDLIPVTHIIHVTQVIHTSHVHAQDHTIHDLDSSVEDGGCLDMVDGFQWDIHVTHDTAAMAATVVDKGIIHIMVPVVVVVDRIK